MLVYGLSLVVLGALSASSLIVQKRPDAKEMLEKLAQYQGWIGVLAAIWGAYVIVMSVLGIVSLHLPLLYVVTSLAIGVVLLGNGFLLGYGLAMTWVKDPAAKAKAQEMYARLLPYQTRLGVAAIVLGLWGVLASLMRL